jgi:hypothetical protein
VPSFEQIFDRYEPLHLFIIACHPPVCTRAIYLIAFKGQSNIRTAQAYWVTENTLHFVTLQGERRQAPINSIDRELTIRLNRERHLDFCLPAEQ